METRHQSLAEFEEFCRDLQEIEYHLKRSRPIARRLVTKSPLVTDSIPYPKRVPEQDLVMTEWFRLICCETIESQITIFTYSEDCTRRSE